MSGAIPAERWTTIEKLFVAAADLPPRDRPAFLDAHCGDDTQLRDEVASLLRYDDGTLTQNAPGLLEALQAGAASLMSEGHVGRMAGPYRIDRELGRGGMSVVYLGSRADGEFSKQVAIKLIKRGMDTDAVVQRLRRERRILAALEHPWIARLLDGGATEDGLPWIAMEYVEGAPISRYSEEQALSIEQRCELIARVCEAVGYAHRNLVIHRDLKPGNILVGRDGNPKLLDFGIARSLSADPDDSEAPLTRELARPYTPEYASPEQVNGDAIGTATDVYSLGVVLFELLTETRPRGNAHKASAAALQNGRGKRWSRRLEGDLDTILEMAMRTEPERRYLSMEQFGLDLRRHLRGMPVTARRETLFSRCGKFLKRHRIAAATAGVLLAVAVAGGVLYVNQARLAARRFEDLHHFANAFLFEVDDRLRGLPGSTSARAVVVEKAVGYLNALAAEKSGDRELQRETGNAWRRVGDAQGDPGRSSLGDAAGARRSYERSIAILEPLARGERGKHSPGDVRSDLVASYLSLARLERVAGNTTRSEELLLRALPIARQVGSPPDPKLEGDLGGAMVLYSWTSEERGRTPEARDQAAEAVGLLESAAAADPKYRTELADALSALAGREFVMGRSPEALAHYRRNLALRQQLTAARPDDRGARRDLMLAWGHIGDVLSDKTIADLTAARSSYEQMLSLAREIASSDPADGTARIDLGIALALMGNALGAVNQPREAIRSYRESISILGEMQRSRSANARVDSYLAFANQRAATQYIKLGDRSQARAGLEKSVSIYDSLAASNPGTASWMSQRLASLEKLLDLLAGGGERGPAVQVVARVEAAARNVESSAKTERQRVKIPEAWEDIGEAFEQLHDAPSARKWYERSLESWTALQPVSKQFADEPERVKQRLARLGTQKTPLPLR